VLSEATSRRSRSECARTSRRRAVRTRDLPVAAARERFLAQRQDYKVELIDDLMRDEGVETVSLYTNGPFTDLCVDRTPEHRDGEGVRAAVGGRRLLARDSRRTMLTRIYGTAFLSKQELDAYLEQLELARQRDHRRLDASSGCSCSASSRRGARSGSRRDGGLEPADRAVA